MLYNYFNMQVVQLCGEINEDMVDKFISFLNSISEDESIRCYIESQGGLNSSYEILLNLINTNKDRIELIFVGLCMSNCFRLAINAKCKKSCLNEVHAMVHMSRVDGVIFPNGTTDKFKHIGYLSDYKKLGICLSKEVKPHLTDSQYKKFLLNEDVYIPLSQFKKIIKS